MPGWRREKGEREDLEATVSFLGWEETMGHTLHALAHMLARSPELDIVARSDRGKYGTRNMTGEWNIPWKVLGGRPLSRFPPFLFDVRI